MSEVRSRKGLKRHDSIYVEVTTASPSPKLTNNPHSKKSSLVHVAEVHDSKTRLLGSSGEENWAQHRVSSSKVQVKQPVQLKKKFRPPRKGSETDTLSEVDSGEASGDGGNESPRWRSVRQDTEETSDRSSQSKTLVVPTARHIKRGSPVDISTSSFETSSTKDSQDYTSVSKRKSRHRGPRRGSLTDTLSEATDSESTIARRPIPPPRPSLESTTVDSQDAFFSQESVDQLSMDQPQPPVRLKKYKRKKKTTDDSDRGSDGVSERTESKSESAVKSELKTSDDMVVVRIESCDTLRFLDFCRCPTVRLHIVDPATGEYRQSIRVPETTVQPLETQPFNMKVHRSVKPLWEEDLIIREPSSLIVSKQSLLLFELFDYVKRNTVAWAFLKLIASNGASNVGKPLRLQMFKPMKNGKQSTTNCPKCYNWWSKGKYSQYKSTLYLSVNCISSPDVDRSPAPPTTDDNKSADNAPAEKLQEDVCIEEDVEWTRYPGQSCKLPNTLLAEKECGKDGSLCLNFSHNGKLLAVPINGGILLYTLPSAKLYLTLDKQQGLVYDMSWSENDEYLLSVSADSTACLWHVKKRNSTPIKILAHPSYVYCCAWIGCDMFATGCSDGVIRAWSLKNNFYDTAPAQFLSKHSARVNSLSSAERQNESQPSDESNKSGDSDVTYILVSGDSKGFIIVWSLDSKTRKFELEKELKVKELRGQNISRVIVSGKKGEASRLIVQTRDSLIRLIDLTNGAVLQIYEGGYIVKSKTGGCGLCGCGRRIWSSSEDSSIMAWDYATGERVVTYSVKKASPHATLCLALHPLDHIVAYAWHSPSNYPTVTLLRFDRSGDGSSIGQVILERGSRRMNGTRWTALDTPLYEVPPVRLRPPASLKPPTSPATPISRLSPATTPVPRSTRRFSGEGSRLGLDTVATALSNIPVRITANRGDQKRLNLSKGASTSKISLNQRMKNETKLKSSEDNLISRDSRLTDIIGKMDLILIQASPKQTASVK